MLLQQPPVPGLDPSPPIPPVQPNHSPTNISHDSEEHAIAGMLLVPMLLMSE
jgi:hypothetical protein